MSTLLVLAFMFLSRIKSPEQLKTCKVGELGRVIGLDRVPEAKCLREKIAQIVNQEKADADLIPDQCKKTLTVRLHTLSTPRANGAAHELCAVLNETEPIFPGTHLRMVYETVQSHFTGGQEV